MAQDLLEIRPDAVIETDSGYMMVDYGKIDVKMMTLQAYKEAQRTQPKANAKLRFVSAMAHGFAQEVKSFATDSKRSLHPLSVGRARVLSARPL